MKKQYLKGLALKKYSVSNLTLLHRKTGGNVDTNTELITTGATIPFTQSPDCAFPNASTVSECATSKLVDCECNTNMGTVKAQPPTKHQECPTNNNNFFD